LKTRDKEPHYSDSGGHKERSQFWKELRKIARETENYSPTKELQWLIRRNMQRVPRDGKI